MNFFKDLDMIPYSHIFKIQIRLYNQLSSQLFPYRVSCTPTLGSPVCTTYGNCTDPTCSRKHHWVYIQPHTTLHIVRLWKHVIAQMLQNHLHFFNTRYNSNCTVTLACIATIRAKCVVACHCILLHGGILHVSCFN